MIYDIDCKGFYDKKIICHENEVPLDFISTYYYSSGNPLSRAGRNGPGTKGSGIDEDVIRQVMEVRLEKFREIMKQAIGGENNNPRYVLAQLTKKVKEKAGELPLYYTEWNAGHFDTNYATVIT